MSVWITSMAHFPKPHQLSKRMPMALIRTTLQFGSIVKMAAAENGSQTSHGCGGKIEASLDPASDKIVWKCTGCDDSGEISHWRGSGWESVPEDKMPKLVISTKKPRTSKNSPKATIVLSKSELSALCKAINDPDELLTSVRPLEKQEVALSLTSKELDDLYRLVGDMLDFGPSRQRKMWDQLLNTIGVGNGRTRLRQG